MLRVVLLSGGLDSSTLLFHVNELTHSVRDELVGVSVDYGQRHVREIESASIVCGVLEAEHLTLKLDTNMFGNTTLCDPSAPLPNASYDDLPEGVSPTYVPFRNGLLISMLAAYTHARLKNSEHGGAGIYIGAHAEDAARDAYPDCSYSFISHMASAVLIATYREVSVHAPFVHDTKAQIVQRGDELNVPFALTWSCYAGGDLHCGTCPTCRARKQAFIKAGVNDPTKYAE